MAAINAEQALAVLHEADLLCPVETVTAALERMAAAITVRLGNRDPVVLLVMNGALIPGGQLLLRLGFPCQIDHLHVTRYRDTTSGGKVQWLSRPSISLEGQVVLVVDDIFDEGITLKAILTNLRECGAREVFSAVLVNKLHDRKEPGLAVDFIGLEVEDRYVFGCGMDYKGYLRNLPAIYAVK